MAKYTSNYTASYGEKPISSAKWNNAFSEVFDKLHLVRTNYIGTSFPTGDDIEVGEIVYRSDETYLYVCTATDTFEKLAKFSDLVASKVNITDLGSYFASTDVEGALQEIGADITTLQTDVSTLQSDVSTLQSDVTNIENSYVKLVDYEDADVLEKIKRVDGDGSGLDADLLKGFPASTSIIANTIPVRDGSGNLPGNITGNAATATNADTVDGYHAGNASGNVPVSNGTVNTNLNADLLDGKHASYFQAMIDQKVDEFIVPLNDGTVVWHKVGELTTDIGTRRNNLTLLVSGVSDVASNKPGVDVVQISTRGGVSVDVYSLTTPGLRTQTYGYVNNTSTGKTEIWVKRDPYTYDTHFAVLNVYDDYGGAAYGNLASSSTEPSGIVYVDIKTYWTSGNDGSGSGLDADTVDGFDASQTPTANTIPVADAAGTISPKWIDVYSLVPYWKVSIDETSGSRTTPTNFTVSRVVKYMSYGLIYWNSGTSGSWGTWSSLWEMKVKSPTAISITGKIVSVDDNVYIYLNNNLVVSATGAGFKNKSFTLNLVSGDNLIQIVYNNSGGSYSYLNLDIDFDWRTLEFVPI